METAVGNPKRRQSNDSVDESSSDFLYTNSYSNLQSDLQDFYSNMQDFVCEEEFQMHIKKYGCNLDNIDEKLRLAKSDVLRTECPIVIAGETSSGKSSIINLILGETILPTGIEALTSRVCRIKYSERWGISTCDTENKILESTPFRNIEEMTKKLESLAVTEIEEISYVDIYIPVPLLQGNVIIVDTPGFDDLEKKVADRVISYLPNALAFVFVVNVPNAGGLLKDRLPEVLTNIRKSMDNMVSFSPEDVIFLLNKWDTIAHENHNKLDEFFEKTKTSLQELWKEVKMSCIFKISAVKVLKKKPKYTADFDMFLTTLKEVIARNENKRIQAHLSFLKTFLNDCDQVLSSKLNSIKENAEKQHGKFDKFTADLEKLEKIRKEVISSIEGNIDIFLDEASFQLHRYLHSPNFRALVLKDTNHCTRISIGQELDARIEKETITWQEKNIDGIFQTTIMADLVEKFKDIHRNLHSIKDNLKGFKTPFDVDNKIATALASGFIPSGAGLIGSLLLKRIISHPGVLIGIAAGGILSGVLFTSLVAFEAVDDFQTVRNNAFHTRISVFTKEEINRTLREYYFDGIQKVIKAFLEGDLKKELIKIEENIIMLKNDHEILKSQKETLSSLQSTVAKKIERLQQIGQIDTSTK